MCKQKFQIGDKVCVKRGNKNEIGRVGNVINIFYKSFRRLCYNVEYNDDKYPKSGVFYADMLLFSENHSLTNHMIKDYGEKNDRQM